ncbi:MAG: alpha/beta hydrolase [Erysipelotrichaceae bacterium]
MKRKRPRIAFYTTLIVILIFSTVIYLGRSYKPSQEALDVYDATDVVIEENSKEILVSSKSEGSGLGFLIYPGGLVEPEAYLPLARETALRFDSTVVIVKFPLNFAFLDWKSGIRVMDKLEIDQWILIGHSLGGAFGSKLAPIDPRIIGTVYLASYPADDLSDETYPSLSLNAQLDAVMMEADFAKNRKKFPANTEFYVIGGANHSQFGSYGLMRDDSVASITPLKQREIILDFIEDWLSSLR